VHELRHKTAASKPCKVNFYNRLYTLTCRYVKLFRRTFLQVAAPDSRVFQSVGTGGRPSPMTPSLFPFYRINCSFSFLVEFLHRELISVCVHSSECISVYLISPFCLFQFHVPLPAIIVCYSSMYRPRHAL